jgi:hypothetical protein
MQQVYVCLWTSGAYYPMQQVFYMTYVSSYLSNTTVMTVSAAAPASAPAALAPASPRTTESARPYAGRKR